MSQILDKVTANRKLIEGQKAALEAALAEMDAVTVPLREERDKLTDAIAIPQARIYEINAQLKEIEQPSRGELQLQLNAINKALDDKRLRKLAPAAEGETV